MKLSAVARLTVDRNELTPSPLEAPVITYVDMLLGFIGLCIVLFDVDLNAPCCRTF